MALSVFSTVMKTVCKALVFDSYLFECEMEITRLLTNQYEINYEGLHGVLGSI